MYVNKVNVIYIALILWYERNRNSWSKKSSDLSNNACVKRTKSSFMVTWYVSNSTQVISLYPITNRLFLCTLSLIGVVTSLFINKYGYRRCLTEVPFNIRNKSYEHFDLEQREMRRKHNLRVNWQIEIQTQGDKRIKWHAYYRCQEMLPIFRQLVKIN